MKNKIIIFLSLIFLPLNYIIGKPSNKNVVKNPKNVQNNSTNINFKKRDAAIALGSGGLGSIIPLSMLSNNNKENAKKIQDEKNLKNNEIKKLQQEITNLKNTNLNHQQDSKFNTGTQNQAHPSKDPTNSMDKIEEISKDLELNEKIKAITNNTNNNKLNKKQLQETINTLQATLIETQEAYEKKLNQMKGDNEKSIEENQSLQSQLQEKINSITLIQNQISTITLEKDTIQQQLSELNKNIQQLKIELSTKETTINDLNHLNTQLKSQLRDAQDQINTMKTYYEIAKKQEEKYKTNMKLNYTSSLLMKAFELELDLLEQRFGHKENNNEHYNIILDIIKNKITYNASGQVQISYENFFTLFSSYYKIIINNFDSSGGRTGYEPSAENQLIQNSLRQKQVIFEDYDYNYLIHRLLGIPDSKLLEIQDSSHEKMPNVAELSKKLKNHSDVVYKYGKLFDFTVYLRNKTAKYN